MIAELSTLIWYIVHSYLAMDGCTAINLVKPNTIGFVQLYLALCVLHDGITVITGAFTTQQWLMHPHLFVYYDKTWMKIILTCFTKMSAEQPPSPNFIDQCIISKKNKCAIIH